MTNSDQPNADSASGSQTKTEGENQGKTPFYRWLDYRNNPDENSLVKPIVVATIGFGLTYLTNYVNEENIKGFVG